MSGVGRAIVLSLSSVLAIHLSGCDALPVDPAMELVVAQAKPVKPPAPTTGELELVKYYVEPASGTHGLTDVPSVDAAVYAHLGGLNDPPEEGDWASHLGCPDAAKACSAVTLEFKGDQAVSLFLGAVPVVGSCGDSDYPSCLLDQNLVNRRDATLRGGWFLPEIPWDLLKGAFVLDDMFNPNTRLTFYWQGQRGEQRVWDEGETVKIRGKEQTIRYTENHWDHFPDLRFPGASGPDQFFFHPVFRISDFRFYNPTYTASRLLAICDTEPGCLAEYTGDVGSPGLEVEFLLSSYEEKAGVAELSVWAFGPDAARTNLESFGRVMMTHPNGITREMLAYDWVNHTSGTRAEDGTAATWYRVEGLDPALCYRFDVVGFIVKETELETFAADNKLTWTGQPDPIFLGTCPSS